MQTKTPLGIDMSYGNSTSTVRAFRRVSSNHHNSNSSTTNISEPASPSPNLLISSFRDPQAMYPSPDNPIAVALNEWKRKKRERRIEQAEGWACVRLGSDQAQAKSMVYSSWGRKKNGLYIQAQTYLDFVWA